MDNTGRQIAIIGGGVIGLSCAISLAQRNMPILLIAKRDLLATITDEQYDARSYALSLSSIALLDQIGITPMIKRYNNFEALEVWDERSDGRIHFDATDVGTERLGIIVEHQCLINALWQRLEQLAIQPISASLQSATIAEQGKCVQLCLDDGEQFDIALLIGADGFHSRVRQLMNVLWQVRDYQQTAFSCVVRTTVDHQLTGWQRFTNHGVIAFLPLAEKTCAVVWSCSNALASKIAVLSPTDFLERASLEIGKHFGELSLVSHLASFPLRGGQVNQYVNSNMALIGDAAHSIHPLAGQGANLGFADLTNLLNILDHSRLDYFNSAMLKRYQRTIKGTNLVMKQGLETLLWLFASDIGLVTQARATGLNCLNTMTSLKKFFMRHAGVAGL